MTTVRACVSTALRLAIAERYGLALPQNASETAMSWSAVPAPVMGRPWPHARTLSSSRARVATDCFAAE
jgi:hypothetical protein